LQLGGHHVSFCCTAGTDTIEEFNLFEDDPAFVDASARDFRLQPWSPAIDRGTAIPVVSSDVIGVSRPQGASHDIGAYERPADGAE